MSRVFVNPLTELAEYEELNRDLNRGKGPVQISGCMDSQKVHLMWEAGETLPWKLVVTYDDSRAKEIYEDFPVLYRRSLAVSGQGPSFL